MFVNIFSELFYKKQSLSLAIASQLPLHKGAFSVHLWLVNFPRKRCICGHKYKNTAYLFRDKPYFLKNRPLGYYPKGVVR